MLTINSTKVTNFDLFVSCTNFTAFICDNGNNGAIAMIFSTLPLTRKVVKYLN